MKLEPGVLEGQTAREDLELEVDTVIIGSGPGGALTAATFTAAGERVIVLDEGGYFTSERFRMDERDSWSQLYMEGGQRVTRDFSVAVLQGRALGGSTVVNWTTSYRTPDARIDFWKSRHNVEHVSAADLAPHFDAVEGRLGIAQVSEAALNNNNRVLFDGCKALGYEAHTLKRNVRGCAQTGFCGAGCPIDAKQSMMLTYLPDAMNAGATCISRARVESLSFAGDEVRAVHGVFLDALGQKPTGKTFTLKAARFVLSAGAIGSAAILLRSGAPDPHQRVGKRTFLHPNVASLAVHDELIEPYYGAPQSAASHEFAERGDEVGYFMEAAPLQPVLASAWIPGIGQVHRDRLQKLKHTSVIISLCLDGFHDDVQGGEVRVHPSGAPFLDYTPSARLRSAFRHSQKSMARVQFAAGAKGVYTTHEATPLMKSTSDLNQIDALSYDIGQCVVGSAHVMGGCAMGEDPRRAVVRSSDLRHHQLKNLHVIDGSVFPTSLGVNPQESIMGLSRLAATRIIKGKT